MGEDIKKIEQLMLAQFIEVISSIGECNDIEEIKKQILKKKKEYLKIVKEHEIENEIFSLNLDDDYIDKKIKKAKKIYPENKPINEVYLAYKIGLIDGMKIKSE